MDALPNRYVRAAENNGARKQFVTLRILAPPENLLDPGLMRALLAGTPGVETIELDPEHERMWIFGDGTVDTEDLLGTLAWWGYGARVISRHLSRPE